MKFFTLQQIVLYVDELKNECETGLLIIDQGGW